MGYRAGWAAVALLVLGCGGSDGEPSAAGGGTGGMGGTGGSAPAADDGGADAEATVQGIVQEMSATSTAPAPGIEVCVLDQEAPCTTSDIAGQYRVEPVPMGTRTGITLTRDGFLSVLIPMLIPESMPIVEANTRMISDETNLLLAGLGGIEWPVAGAGSVTVIVRKLDTVLPTLPGAMVETIDASPQTTVYFDAAGRPDPSLGATTDSGIVVIGTMGAGLVRLRVTYPGGRCVPAWGYAGENDEIETPVREGWMSQVLVVCEVP